MSWLTNNLNFGANPELFRHASRNRKKLTKAEQLLLSNSQIENFTGLSFDANIQSKTSLQISFAQNSNSLLKSTGIIRWNDFKVNMMKEEHLSF
ncbi:MAG: hypothetical protein ABIS36_12200 [Chryseolinea sp.]